MMKLQALLCIWISFSNAYIVSASGFCVPEPDICSECKIFAFCQTDNKNAIIPQSLPETITGIDILYRGNESAILSASFFTRYPKLINITLLGAEIAIIEDRTFSNLKHLKYLSIYKTSISYFPPNILPTENHIVYINFGANLLTEIPMYLFENLSELTHLDLGFNRIVHNNCTTIGYEFKHLTKLDTLILSNMTIPNECKFQVPADFFLPIQNTVRKLNLTISNIYNGSQSIFFNFSKLLELDISIAEGFTECPAQAKDLFRQLPKTLKMLFFRRWRTNRMMNKTCIVTNETFSGLKMLPNLTSIDTMFSDFMFGDILNKSVFSGFQNLKTLNIGYNRFALVEDDAFHGCQNLYLLHIEGNSLGSRPFKLFESRSLSALQSLHMRECYVYSDYSISYNAAPLLKVAPLTRLDLRHNYIVTMPSFADHETDQQHWNSLKRIDLDFNELSDIQSGGNLSAQCDSLTALRSLSISNNRLKKVEGLCLSITELNLASNRLHLFWDKNEAAISLLKHLIVLDISDNQIDKLKKDFTSSMRNLTHFRCISNNLTSIDTVSFFSNPLLKVLDLSNGFLTNFSYDTVRHLSKLTTLYLDDNDITSIEKDLVTKFVNKSEALKTFGVIGNPLSCLCDQEFFKDFIRKTTKVPFANKLKCHDPASLQGVKIYQYKLRTFECHIKNVFIAFVSLLGGIILAIPLYKYRWYLAHMRVVFKAVVKHLSDVRFEQTCLYDAYVMYNSSSEEDQLWATRDLRVAIEESSTSISSSKTNLKLYIPDRDAPIGSNIYTEMISAMEKSRKIIIVLSNSFLRKPSCKGQADLAGRESFGRKYYRPHRIMVLVRERLDEEAIKAPFASLLMENVVDAQTTDEQRIKRIWQRIRKFIAQPTYEYAREEDTSLEKRICTSATEDNKGTDGGACEELSEAAPLVP